MEASRLLGIPNLILARHINFTLFTSKILGHSTHLDPLDIFFNMFLRYNIIDILPIKNEPIVGLIGGAGRIGSLKEWIDSLLMKILYNMCRSIEDGCIDL